MNGVNSPTPSDTLPLAAKLFAVFLGIAIPSLAFGRVVFAVCVSLALIALFVCRSWREVLGELIAQCRTLFGMLILLTFIAWLPNLFFSNFPIRSFEAVFRTLIFVAVGSVFCSALSSERRLLDVSLHAFCAMTAISISFALVAMTVLPEIYWAIRFEGWLSQPVATRLKGFSALGTLVVPVLVLAGYRLSTAGKFIATLLSVGFLAVISIGYNRSAMAGLLAMVAAVMVAVLLRRGTRRSVLISLFGFGAVLAGTAAWLRITRANMITEIQKFAPGSEWNFPVWLVDYERQTIWSHALDFASDSPWFGIGANTINFVPGADAIIQGTRDLHVIPAHPHSWAVELFAELGAVGLAMVLITIGVLAWQALIGWRRSGQVGLLVAIAVMAGYWGSGLFNFSYWSAWWQVSFLICLAYGYAHARQPVEMSDGGGSTS